MKSFVHRDLAQVFLFAFAAGAALCFCARNSGPGESESKMTSFTSSESKAETAELFTVPSEQLGHVQIVAAEKGPLPPTARRWLVACLGLLPAAMSTGVGSDTQKPFAIVVVAGLLSRLFLGFFVNPVLYEIVAREGDVLKV